MCFFCLRCKAINVKTLFCIYFFVKNACNCCDWICLSVNVPLWCRCTHYADFTMSTGLSCKELKNWIQLFKVTKHCKWVEPIILG